MVISVIGEVRNIMRRLFMQFLVSLKRSGVSESKQTLIEDTLQAPGVNVTTQKSKNKQRCAINISHEKAYIHSQGHKTDVFESIPDIVVRREEHLGS